MKFLSSILLAIALCSFAPKADAYVDSAKGVVIFDSQNNLSLTTFTTVVSSLTKAVKGVSISNTAVSDIEVAIGASSSEQVQLIIPGNGHANSQIFYPIALSQGLRVAIRARDSAAVIGKQIFNFFYY